LKSDSRHPPVTHPDERNARLTNRSRIICSSRFILSPDWRSFLWPEMASRSGHEPLVRMSQGRMAGVDFNKDKTWVGSIALYRPI